MIIDWPAAVREARTRRLLDNLATLRKRRDAIFAELDSIRARQAADVAPCDYCGNEFEATNCDCEAPTWAHFDY